MDRKRPLVTYLVLGSALSLSVWAAVFMPRRTVVSTTPPPVVQVVPKKPLLTEPVVQKPSQNRPVVDVVFVLDTTGSMSSLLDGAKKKVWELARFIAQGQPAPDLRIGLVAYRDEGDEYVTKFFDLTDDLDGVYQNLSAFTAGGGGDTPEHVAKGLSEAVQRASWSTSKNALKLIYLVGDAPPHTDYQDGLNFRAIAMQAKERNIRINTVRCGRDEDTKVAWTEIASRTGGEFSTIDQSGGMNDVHTPFDEELAHLNRALTETAVIYGDADRRGAVRAKTMKNLEAPAEAQAARAGLFGLFGRTKGKSSAVSEGDLLDDVENKKVDVGSLAPAALPEPMQAMNTDERNRYISTKKEQRQEVLNKINAISAKRDAFLKEKAPAASGGFDGKVRESIKKQAADVGLMY